MQVTVKNIQGKDTERKVTLPAEIFGIDPNEHVVYLEVKRLLAANRQGTHKTKERGELSGSRKKLRRQKGTGTARVGDIKSPILRGGGRVFGPKPRDYDFKLNKKERQLARKSALAQKAKDKQIVVLEDFAFDKPETGKFAEILQALELNGKKSVWIMPDHDANIYLSCRNIPGVNMKLSNTLNTYETLNNQKLVFTESALKSLTENLSGKKS